MVTHRNETEYKSHTPNGLRPTVIGGVGLSVVLAAGVFVLPIELRDITGGRLRQTYLLASVLLLPLSFALVQRCWSAGEGLYAAQRQKARGMLFVTGWLSLAGYACLGAVLFQGVVDRLGRLGDALFGNMPGTLALVGFAGAVALFNELHDSPSRWRAKTWGMWLSTGLLACATVYLFLKTRGGAGVLPSTDLDVHSLAAVAVLAVALWAVDLALDYRTFCPVSHRAFRNTLLAGTVVVLILGMFVGALALRMEENVTRTWLAENIGMSPRTSAVFILCATYLCAAALSRVISRLIRLTTSMMSDGFFGCFAEGAGVPGSLLSTGRWLAIIMVLSVACLATNLSMLLLASASAACLLANVVLAGASHAFANSRERKDEGERNILTMMFAAGIAAVLILTLPKSALLAVLLWGLVGSLHYLAVGRRGALAVSREEFGIFDDTNLKSGAGVYRVMVCAGQETLPGQGEMLCAAAVARENDGEIVLLGTVLLREQASSSALRKEAEHCLARLQGFAGRIDTLGVPVRCIARIAAGDFEGVSAAVDEFMIDQVVVPLGGDSSGSQLGSHAFLRRAFAQLRCQLVAVGGSWQRTARRWAIADGGGPHVPAANQVAQALSRAYGGKIEGIRIGESRIADLDSGSQGAPGEQADDGATRREGASAYQIMHGIVDGARGADLLLIGASVSSVWGQAAVGGIAEDIVRERDGAVCVVKGAEKRSGHAFRQLWAGIFSRVPTLTRVEVFDLYAAMRHDARAGIDFYILIALASVIATFGLLQNSGAVIIGAMLVAPLMSPILALAHGIVVGNSRMVRRSAMSVLRGVAAAIAISATAVMLIGKMKPSSEILGRTQPDLLDLVVAGVSGAAAAYAISRKSVSAALPGVAISAALVPPLCVVGFGIGVSNFAYAGGALLLFATNLSMIVLVGAIVFLLLGVKPTRTARGRLTRAYLSAALVALLLVSVPLSFSSRSAMTKERIEDRIEAAIAEIPEEMLRIDDTKVDRDSNGYVAEMTVYVYNEEDMTEVEGLSSFIAEKVSAPVRVRCTIVRAEIREVGTDDADTGEMDEPEQEQ